VKLTRDNFLLWQAHILSYLRSQRLISYVTGVISSPPSTLPAAAGATTQSNPAYAQWFEQDQAILNAILASLSPDVLSQCLFLKTSKAVWDKLDSLYAAQSRALTMQLATLKKQELLAMDYFSRVKGITDNLAAAGEPLRDDEIIAYLLTGLPEEYDSLVTSVNTRVEPMSLNDIYTNLLSFEMRLIQCQAPSNPMSHPRANYAARGGAR
jgi:hypothetical protein